MSDLFELRHPTGGFTVKVDAERADILRARGYHDVGTTTVGDFGATVISAEPKPPRVVVTRKPKPRKPPAKAVRRK